MFTYVIDSSRKKNREYRKLFRKIKEFDSAEKKTPPCKIRVRKETFLFFFLDYVEIHYLTNGITFPLYIFFRGKEITIRTYQQDLSKEYVDKVLNMAVEAVKEYLERKKKESIPIYL